MLQSDLEYCFLKSHGNDRPPWEEVAWQLEFLFTNR